MLNNSFKDVFMQEWLKVCSQHNTDLLYDRNGFNFSIIKSLKSFDFSIFKCGCNVFLIRKSGDFSHIF